jgi:hypothetical protein
MMEAKNMMIRIAGIIFEEDGLILSSKIPSSKTTLPLSFSK